MNLRAAAAGGWRALTDPTAPAGRLVWTALAVVVAVGIALAVVREAGSVDRATFQAFHLDIGPLVLAYLVQSAGWLLVVWMWARVLGPAPPRLPAATHLNLYALSALAHVVPGSVLAPASRIALYRRAGVDGVRTGTALVVEWLLVGIGGLVLYAVAAPFSTALPPWVVRPLAVVAIGGLVMLHPSVRRPIVRQAVRRLGAPPAASTSLSALSVPALARILVVETVALALSGFGLYLLMLGIAPRASLADAMSAWAMTIAISNLLAWMPMTSVVKDGGMILLLAPLYESTIVAGAVVIAWRLWAIALQLSWAGIAAVLHARTRGVP